MLNYQSYCTIWIPNIDTAYCVIDTGDVHSFSLEYGWLFEPKKHNRR